MDAKLKNRLNLHGCSNAIKVIQDLEKQLQSAEAFNKKLASHCDALAAHVERLVRVCELARDNYGKMLLTDPPQEAWKANQVTARLVEAIASTPKTSLAEVRAQQAEESFLVGASWAMGKKLETVARHDKHQAKKHADTARNGGG